MTENLEKISLKSLKCCGVLSSDPSHRKTDGACRPQGEVHNFNPHIFNLYRFQIDPNKTPGQVQGRTLEKITWISKMLFGPKFRHLSQTNGRTDIAPKGSCTTSTHIYSICIGFRLIRLKPWEEFRTKHWKKITWNCQMLSGPKFRRLSQTNGRTDAYIVDLKRFQVDPAKTLRQVQHTKLGLCVCIHARTMAKISSMSQIT